MGPTKISTRLALLLGTVSTVMIIVGAVGMIGTSKANESMRTIYDDRLVCMGQISTVDEHIGTVQIALIGASLAPTPDGSTTAINLVENSLSASNKVWSEYTGTTLTTDEARMVKEFEDLRAHLMAEATMPALAALKSKDMEQAKNLVLKVMPKHMSLAKAKLSELMQLQLDVAMEENKNAVARYELYRNLSTGLIAGGLLLSIWMGTTLIRGISAELGTEPAIAAALVSQVAEGNLAVSIPLRRGDTSSLLCRLKEMQDKLSDVVRRVRNNSESVATASSEIAQGNLDLSQRTEEQASALQQTAASMEQLGATVRLNADNAVKANELAQGASEVAIKGGTVVGKVVETMKGINDSSKRIADIISVIDGIAFQTNILALNAAVEAARAGDQGRGFAVVAGEVRGLAQRSADAAKEIKELINASVDQVAKGSSLVDQAGSTMEDIVGAIQRVTSIMGEISTASVEQSSGVSQISTAVAQMDQVTQQNAALVEESASAAESLSHQAKELLQTVEVFKLHPAR